MGNDLEAQSKSNTDQAVLSGVMPLLSVHLIHFH